MERGLAVRLLSADAWRHIECGYSGKTETGTRPLVKWYFDIFLYGRHDYESAAVVAIKSELVNGDYLVYFVGKEESYRLHLYDECTHVDLADRDK